MYVIAFKISKISVSKYLNVRGNRYATCLRNYDVTYIEFYTVQYSIPTLINAIHKSNIAQHIVYALR